MSEIHEQIRVCNFIKSAYSDVIFCSDLSGLKLSISVARLVKLLRSGNGFTDIFLFKSNDKYKALFIEMKKTGTKILNKKGEYKTDHLKDQAEMIKRLNSEGYLQPSLLVNNKLFK